MRYGIGLVVGLIMLGMGVVMMAQDAATLPEFACLPVDYTELKTQLTDIPAGFDDAATDPALVLLTLRAAIDTFQARCTGGLFTYATHPSGIVGPIAFSGTLYELTLTIPEADIATASMSLIDIEGDCGLGFPTMIPGTSGGSQTDLLEFGGDCVAMFEVNVVGVRDWSLTIKKLK
jgi:hypothetical protein